jgi:polysaccharide biosynthesis/export protein
MKKLFLTLCIIFLAQNLYSQVSTDSRFSIENLMKEGFISVTLGGDFIVNGTFPALLSERADQFITRVFNNAKEQALQRALVPEQIPQILAEINSYQFRGISLKRSNGEEYQIDLVKFRMNGDFANNPFLRNEDVLIFPTAGIATNFFTVSGAVNSPGRFYYMEGDDLNDAIELAGGLNESYENLSLVEIHRLDFSGSEYTVTNTSIGSNHRLQRGDRVIIKADESQRRAFTVRIVGEVNSPGEIPITKNSTTIKDVINQAGGVKETAALNRARLYSERALNLLLERRYGFNFGSTVWNKDLNEFILNFEHSLFYRMSNVTEEDSLYFIVENEIRTLNEGSSIDFTELNESGSEVSNYVVKDGDIIIIPAKLNKLYVFGQVNNPGYVTLERDRDYLYYINKAGGYGEFSDGDRTMIIKGESYAWYSPDSGVEIEDGDYIFVPRDPVRSFSFYLQRVTNYLTIAGSIATIVLLLVQLTK